jgi:crotonobetainyl-CoA:carnitine CoA-transferase CaiB-like acyl-CoA transferase
MAFVLDGIQVLDLSWGIAGPIATMLLGDHGARVTRIERPAGDPFRSQLGYKAWNRGKRSAVLNLEDAADRETFLRLAACADVLVESFRPGVTTRLGIDYPALSKQNPRLIYCSITGYGRDNPHSDRPAYDALVAARTGLQWEVRGRRGGSTAYLAGREPLFPDFEVPQEAQQGPPRGGPLFPASRFPSLGAAYAATTAISAALRAREITGRGQWVETSLLQGALAAGVLAYAVADKLDAPHFLSWIGDSRSPKGFFRCQDGRWVHMWVPNPRFALAAGAGDALTSSPDLSVRDDPQRIAMAPEEIFVLDHYWKPMADTFAKFTAEAWTQAGAEAEVCIQKVKSPEEGLSDPLLFADRCVADSLDPELGAIRTVGISYRLERSPGAVGAPPVAPGTHTEQVRAEAARAVPARASAPAQARSLPKGPLEGIRALDFGLAVAGPYCTQVLSDLGADVIKVNALHDWYWHSNQIAMVCNRGKRSLAIDLKHARAGEVVKRLIASADVVMHNMRYPAAVKLGIDYASLRGEFPRLVYCHTRGFEHGPRELLPGNDQTGACLAGVSWEDGGCHRGGRPLWALTNLGDTGNGFLAAIAICQALFEREKTGRGQFVETSIVNAQLLNTSCIVSTAAGQRFERPLLDRMHLGFCAGVRLYETREGWICLSLVEEAHWAALGRALGSADFAAGGRWGGDSARRAHDDEIAKWLEQRFAGKTAAQCFEELDRAGVPCEISSEIAGRELWKNPLAASRKWIASYPHRMVGQIGQIGLAFSLSDTPARIQGPPMLVGEHTRSILGELGYASGEIDAFFAEKLVADESVYPALAAERAARR